MRALFVITSFLFSFLVQAIQDDRQGLIHNIQVEALENIPLSDPARAEAYFQNGEWVKSLDALKVGLFCILKAVKNENSDSVNAKVRKGKKAFFRKGRKAFDKERNFQSISFEFVPFTDSEKEMDESNGAIRGVSCRDPLGENFEFEQIQAQFGKYLKVEQLESMGSVLQKVDKMNRVKNMNSANEGASVSTSEIKQQTSESIRTDTGNVRPVGGKTGN